MKKRISLFLLTLVHFTAFAQPCSLNSSSTLYLTSQSQLDEFASKYPTCTILETSLRISGDDITNLSSLNNIATIQGYLRISDCPALQTLDGFQNLTNVEEYIAIEDNQILSSISAINNLEKLGGYFRLDNLPMLLNLGQFTKLDSITGELRLQGILGLQPNVFTRLSYVNSMYIRDNNFTTFTDFPNLLTIEESVNIYNCPLLTEINGFSRLERIGEDITIENNIMLKSIAGFEDLLSIGNNLELLNNPALNDIDQAFNALETISHLFYIKSTGLQNLSGFQRLHTTGPILINLNPEMSSFSGLEAVRNIDGELYIWDNTKLVDISPLEDVDYSEMKIKYNKLPGKGSILFITGNPLLQNCDIQLICDLLKRTYPYRILIENNGNKCSQEDEVLIGQCKSHYCFAGGLSISSEEEIEILFEELPVCNYIEGDLIIGDDAILANNKVLNLSELSFIDTIMGDIIIENTLLKGVVGLSSIKYIAGNLKIVNNKNLENLNILTKTLTFKEIVVENNPKLGDKIDLYLIDMEGDITIKNNPLLETIDIEFRSDYKGNIIIDENPLATVEFDFDNQYYLGGSLLIRNVKRNQFLNIGGVSGDIHLEQIGSFNNTIVNVDTILGSLIFKNNRGVELMKIISLEYIGGDLLIIDNEDLRLFTSSGSSNDQTLRYIGGDLKIINTKFTDDGLKEEFEYLRTIGGELVISNNSELEALTAFNSLIYNTTSGITVTNNEKLEDCNLKTLCWHMANGIAPVEINGNNGNCLDYNIAELHCDLDTCVGGLWAHKQEQINRWLEINEVCKVIPDDVGIEDITPAWDTLSLLGLKNIVAIEGNTKFGGGELDSLTGFDNLEYIGGDLTFENNKAEFDISALRNLKAIGGELESSSNLTSFIGLEKLERVGSIKVSVGNGIESLEGLESLTTIDGRLSLSFLDIKSLKGLENVEYIGGQLYIFNLDQLTDISALNKIAPETISSIKIHGNDKLKECNLRLFCEFLLLHPPSPNYILRDNGEGCFDDDLDCDLYDINGIVYFDVNQNGIRDFNDFGIPNISLENNGGLLLTNENGEYRQFFEDNDLYSVSLADDPLWILTSSPEEHSGQVDSSSYVKKFDFGLTPNFNLHQAKLNITSNNIRCSESGTYFINVQNTGTFIESGEIHFRYDPNMAYEMSNITPNDHNLQSGLLIWKYSNLNPFETIEIEVEMQQPDFNFAGDKLISTLKLYTIEGSDLQKLSDYTYETILRCSYDPNDKQISPVGISSESFILRDNPVTYTIRFQNTGNDYARNVLLVDTLPQVVDMASFKVVNTSHEVFVSIDDNVVIFNFPDIYLIDSLTNPDQSQGFVSFQVQIDHMTPDSTLIENNANIFFDFNPPVITNSVVNTVVEDFPTSLTEIEDINFLKIFPNPFKSLFNLSVKEVGQLKIYNASIGLIIDIDLKEKHTQIDLTNHPEGIYFVSLTTQIGGVIWKKLVKQ